MSLYPEWVVPLQRMVDEDVRTEEMCTALWIDAWEAAGKEAAAAARKEAEIAREQRVANSDCEAHTGGRFAHRCRKCPACLRLRSQEWTARAKHEWFSHERCWWITLTFRGSVPKFYEEVQKWLKRVRSSSNLSIRYLVSEETGERRNRLHWHVLLFSSKSVTKRCLTSRWKHGFSKCVLARTVGVLRYVSKYASKVGRLRASVGFGNGLRAIARARPDLAQRYDDWLFGGADRPDFVRVFGSVISKHKVVAWWNVPPF